MTKYILQITLFFAFSVFLPLFSYANEPKNPLELTNEFYVTTTKEILISLKDDIKTYSQFFAPLVSDSIGSVEAVGNLYLALLDEVVESGKYQYEFISPLVKDSVNTVSGLGETYLAFYVSVLESARDMSALAWQGTYLLGDVL